MQDEKFYGAKYSTKPYNFGRIEYIFEVGPDWQGYRYHGYCIPTKLEVAEWLSDSGNWGEQSPRA